MRAAGADLARLGGYPFEVRHSEGASRRARIAADLATDAYGYLSGLFGGVQPSLAVIVADAGDWPGRVDGLPYFNDDPGQLRPGIVVMPAGGGAFSAGMVRDIRDASPHGYARLRAAYPDGAGGVDLQPFLDLITIHELGHAFEVLGDLRTATDWLSEIFANLVLHAFVATRRPERLATLETLPRVGAASRRLAARWRAEGYSTLEQLQDHYTGGEDSMDPLNYAWYQYRWQRLAAAIFDADGEAAVVRFWECFHGLDRVGPGEPVTAAALAPLLGAEVSPVLGRAVREWR